MLEQFRKFIDELRASNSRLHKEAVLKAYECNDDIKRIVKFIFNPYVVTGISKKKFYRKLVYLSNTVLPDIWAVMDYLTEHNHGSDQDIANIQEFCIGNKGYEDIIYAIVCKDLTVGVTATTINKIWGKGFIPMSPEHRKRISNSCKGKTKNKGRIYINNGKELRSIVPEDLDKYLELGYVRGRYFGDKQPWNKGLKATEDERVKRMSRSLSRK